MKCASTSKAADSSVSSSAPNEPSVQSHYDAFGRTIVPGDDGAGAGLDAMLHARFSPPNITVSQLREFATIHHTIPVAPHSAL